VALGRRVGAHTYRNVGLLYLATPALLHRAGLDESRVDERTDVVTNRTGALSYVNVSDRRPPAPRVEQVDGPAYSSAPTSLITPNGLRRRGWRPAPTAWLVEADRPLTGTQVDAARDMAAAAGMTVESRHHQRSLAAMRSGATAAGMLLALGVLAVTVGLIRSEAAGELRVLTATGATSAIRRVLTATTAGALAFLGVLLGTVGAYLGLIGGYADQLDRLSRVPVLHLLVTVVGVPMVAASAGWLLAGREPPSLARHPLE
jgi:putative ABC transport system permease protein